MGPIELFLAQPPGVQAVFLIGGLVVLVCVIGLALDERARRRRGESEEGARMHLNPPRALVGPSSRKALNRPTPPKEG